MYGSYIKRDSWLGFVKSRAKRIVPPYVKIVLLCAIGLSLVSTLPLTKYFTDAGLWKYLAANLAFLNFLQPTLPGVFEHNNVDAVNGSLWTLKVEWMLYLTIPVFFFLIRNEDVKNHSWDEIRAKKLYKKWITVRNKEGEFDTNIKYTEENE